MEIYYFLKVKLAIYTYNFIAKLDIIIKIAIIKKVSFGAIGLGVWEVGVGWRRSSYRASYISR